MLNLSDSKTNNESYAPTLITKEEPSIKLYFKLYHIKLLITPWFIILLLKVKSDEIARCRFRHEHTRISYFARFTSVNYPLSFVLL